MRVVLISTYELGRQPFGLASPAAWLRRAGAEVTAFDVSRQRLDEGAVRDAGLIAIYLPMHTATRIALRLLETIRRLNSSAHICCYGLYAPVNAEYLRRLGVQTIIGGEFEQELVRLYASLRNTDGGAVRVQGAPPPVSLERLHFIQPERTGLPALTEYARVHLPGGGRRVAGYTEATRGCKHLCRHCPIVPVYNGAFRAVQAEVVLADIRQQVAAGAEHITFGDPDFFNGPAHARRIVRLLHAEFPEVTYDVTIKVEHLLRQRALLPELRDTGCLFITSAVESVDDAVLERLDKGHTRADFYEVVRVCRATPVALAPTFVPFTPWTTAVSYCDLLAVLAGLGLVESVAPIQLAIRLLIPAGSRLLELDEVRRLAGLQFREEELSYTWRHPDAAVDELAWRVRREVANAEKEGQPRAAIFERVWQIAHEAAGAAGRALRLPPPFARAAVPYLNEPWYC